MIPLRRVSGSSFLSPSFLEHRSDKKKNKKKKQKKQKKQKKKMKKEKKKKQKKKKKTKAQLVDAGVTTIKSTKPQSSDEGNHGAARQQRQ